LSIVVWIVLGIIGGSLTSVLLGAGGYGAIGDMVVGALGAVTGGWLASMLLVLDVTGLNLTSIAIAVVGAIILIVVFRAVTAGRRSAV
jgi:uncharacterized membrane protein YeaQ/YmgE (transglycosylase-associated protein family)